VPALDVSDLPPVRRPGETRHIPNVVRESSHLASHSVDERDPYITRIWRDERDEAIAYRGTTPRCHLLARYEEHEGGDDE
jgi:hypothetical protein